MHITKTLTAVLCLGTGALSYKVRIFPGANCGGGAARDLNIFDNTCRSTDLFSFRSFRVLGYGAGRQRAKFWSGSICHETNAFIQDWWADGGSDTFKTGTCITLPKTAKSLGSYSS
ncbi:hypothetical protein ACHAQF_008994 [Verticillium nonalfalfae]|uniref:Uncharacterized protein n=1 Tax=Verticillium dahliae TaxID=27337 RepID=A0AA45ARM6_VERDA|nr:hypothetical protein EV126DRAFT_42861 [Verticillium dahliae]PNH36630.1 hypothetical protein BJF96_g587 [Verticillium dahliae]